MKRILLLSCLAVIASCSMELPSEETVTKLIMAIPDHEIKEGSESSFSSEYYSLLRHAWDVPSDYPVGIGSEEWLYYFISGQDYPDVVKPPVIDKITSKEIHFTYLDRNHTMKLKKEDGRWVISDFDGTKEQLKEYIERQRAFFKSRDWEKTLTEIRQECGDDEASNAQESVEEYFMKYR